MVGLTSRVLYKRLGNFHFYVHGVDPRVSPSGRFMLVLGVSGWKLPSTANGLHQRSEALREF